MNGFARSALKVAFSVALMVIPTSLFAVQGGGEQPSIATAIGAARTLDERLAADKDAIRRLEAENERLRQTDEEGEGSNPLLRYTLEANEATLLRLREESDRLAHALDLRGSVAEGRCPPGSSLLSRNRDGSLTCQVEGMLAGRGRVIVLNGAKAAARHRASAQAQCPDRYQATGGGFLGAGDTAVTGSYPTYLFNGWGVDVVNSGSYATDFFAYALCLKGE